MSEQPWLLPECAPEPPPSTGAVGANETLPPGPFSIGMTYDGEIKRYTPPYTIKCGDGRCVVGWIESRVIAERLAVLLNETEGVQQ